MFSKILSKFKPEKSNLIFILHALQDNHPQQYVSADAVIAVSDYLGVPENHIYGVLTFYSMFSTRPRGANIIRLCESPPCWLRGSTNVFNALTQELGIKKGETTPDGLFTLELCACLGVCGNAPVMMINNDVYADLTPASAVAIIKNIREAK